MKILITGAHFTPAQAVIEELQKEPDIKITYLGRKYTQEGDKSLSVESQILPKLGVKFIPVIAGRLQRSFTIYTIPSLFKVPLGALQSFYILLKDRPDVVLSFGGYVSVPVVISAWLLSIPIITHEQTLVSGLANTINSWFADKVAVSFPNHEARQNSKQVLTGNPIRREVLEPGGFGDEEIKKIAQLSDNGKLPLLLVTGGNQGSHVINLGVLGVLRELIDVACVVHQTGDSKFKDYDNLKEMQKTLKKPERYLVRKWLEAEEMGVILEGTDLVISRAGANTLLELAFLGIPALVIPIPYLHKNEQMVNAKYFEKLGLVRVLLQKELNPENLLSSVKDMLKNLPKLKEEAKEAGKVVVPDAAKRLALETILLANEDTPT
ncbi:hypothetical protein A3A14_04425 [Candidatus Daviesbacteria bacterium RIFCSPLOWO2_01_FULL_43_38]|uniref:UDP-N-acetylglucosamine--N-acetylmuramyl-(pentapeptide) pyrophosphoryl-undecaprenol N-acetylglucosamine transferase n=1 Tax=Candidatus Daviesbacteria bacterium GW2011_GWA2_42_7 TaxID=1618425 RepID=A0A0G1BD30_9BACT|nr:MAG: hypothetical protein UV41_C0004G0021 [Candidatus Daviesbacteria bacterium GW2011_GWA2_42_7]OGE63778.1 MAG: hypothetical protein A3A14_04425 [Candidatus Daviesbacteria bacterium RIFCSPLOWO2_01_FULL_43_38]